ncbi:hypothetical protein [Halomonas sp. 707B3]|uniref:hypothetical protein n=1 Tax=Halomonas sp. 707B3 TaxID=1681043 RepID=UPI00209DC903|nr:hypothetical protein [Halomonas sp. 707B3]MCP1316877.1 hypothetical protein [Halomonas sp. 707B3]
MKLTQRDLSVKLSDKEKEPSGNRKLRGETLYAKVRDYEPRTVSIPTAYARLYRYPDMSLHDACTIPNFKRHSSRVKLVYRGKPIMEQVPPEYIADLDSDKTNSRIAYKWKLSWPTVKRHRQFLKEDRENAERSLP